MYGSFRCQHCLQSTAVSDRAHLLISTPTLVRGHGRQPFVATPNPINASVFGYRSPAVARANGSAITREHIIYERVYVMPPSNYCNGMLMGLNTKISLRGGKFRSSSSVPQPAHSDSLQQSHQQEVSEPGNGLFMAPSNYCYGMLIG